jgi:MarR family transcriptional regulator, organic hydroperoxide resistance regulator
MSRDRDGRLPALPVLNEDPRPWEVRVCVALIRFHAKLDRRLSGSLARRGLSGPQFDVLATLWHGEGITQQELAERLLVTKGNVVGLLDRTAAAGWVERRPDAEDRRINRLYLTDAGRDLLAAAMPAHHDDIRSVFGVLTEGELRLMSKLLARLEEASRGCG